MVRLLLKTGTVNADSRDSHGRTPLLHAARNGHTDVVKFLLETGTVDVEVVELRDERPYYTLPKRGTETLSNFCSIYATMVPSIQQIRRDGHRCHMLLEMATARQ